MADPKGFMKYNRKEAGYRPIEERVRDFAEVEQTLNTEDRVNQAARCMDCGIPFCNWHCTLGNVIPEFNDAIYRGNWKEAYFILESTNNFPEFTGRICPALCEHSCVLNRFDEPVTIRENEVAIAERAFMEGIIKPRPPKNRTGKKVAVIGSGPAGLVVADDLNKAGHSVTLFEKDNAVGGLLRYGIPDFKLNKYVIDRRVRILEQEGLKVVVNTNVGIDITAKQLLEEYDAICLTIGAMKPRDIQVEGRDLKGIHFAMDFLKQQNKIVRGDEIPATERISAKDKHVVVIGGGDTGADCVGTSNRQGAKTVTQLEILPKPPAVRDDNNPWPYYAFTLRTSSSHKEGCERYWSVSTKKFTGENGQVKKLEAIEVEWVVDASGRKVPKEIDGKTMILDADLVLLALGFVHPVHEGLVKGLGLELDARGNIKAQANGQTTVRKVFAAGDSVSGASLVLKAMKHGKDIAAGIDGYLRS